MMFVHKPRGFGSGAFLFRKIISQNINYFR
nr:MAG TPA: hypothetical protein [Caudoviricetes sp.]